MIGTSWSDASAWICWAISSTSSCSGGGVEQDQIGLKMESGMQRAPAVILLAD